MADPGWGWPPLTGNTSCTKAGSSCGSSGKVGVSVRCG